MRRAHTPSKLFITTSIVALIGISCGDDSTTETGSALEAIKAAPSSLGVDQAADLVELWRVETPPGVTGTPVILGETAYFADWDGIVRSIDTSTGAKNWSTKLPIGVSASPTAAWGMLYVMDLGTVLHAIDLEDGTVQWSSKLDEQDGATGFSSPVAAGAMIVVGISGGAQGFVRGSIVAVEADTGVEIWRTWTDSGSANQGASVSVWSTAVVDDERQLAFIGTGNTNDAVMTDSGSSASHLANSILALDLSDGEVVWTYRFVELDRGRDFDVGARPNLFTIDGRDVVGVGAKLGDYAVFDRASGEMIWRVNLTTGSAIGGVMGVAAVDEGSLLVVSNSVPDFSSFSSHLFSLDLTTGTTEWETELDGINIAGASVANGVAYLGTSTPSPTDGSIYAIDTSDGSILWRLDPGTRVGSRIVPTGDVVLVGVGFGGVGGGFSGVDNGALIAFAAG